VLFLFMRDLRTVLIAFVSIPLALLTAVIVLDRMGSTLNTMTLGGLAVALGVVVDDAVIGTENIVKRIRSAAAGASPREVILAASVEVRAPVVYATLMLALVLLPVLLLHGLQGSFFSPLAASFIIATLASLAVAVLITPPLALLLLHRGRLHGEPGFLRHTKHGHERLLKRAIAAPGWSLAAAAVAVAITAAGFVLFDSELLPSFRESHFVLSVTGPPGTSLAVMKDYGAKISKELLAIDGVADLEQQLGRSQGGEDPFGTEQSELHVELKPGLSGAKQDAIQKRIHEILDSYPGLKTEVLTFLGDRIGESLSGETAALVVGIYGADLDTLDKVADQVADVMKAVPGAVDVQVQTPPKTPVIRVDLNFPALTRFGVAPADALAAIGAAYQGAAGAKIFQETRTIDIAVTTPPDLKRDPEAVGDLLVRSATGTAVPLKAIAKVYLTDTRTLVSHEGGRPRQVVTSNPSPRDVAKVTKAAQAAVAAKVKLPAGVYLEYTGTAQGAAEARKELLFNTALAIGGVVALLLLAFGSGRATVLILGATPFALVGGVIAVALTGGSLSLGSLVGFVTLFGVAARNAILLVARLQQLTDDEGHPWSIETVLLGTRERVTPILMTALVTGLGVLPLALSSGQAGREIQGPMAVVILGGLITSTMASLLLLPALAWRYGRKPVAT
jgi:Cu/Ag efflux pump CusA